MENKGFETDDGIIDIHIEKSLSSKTAFIHNFLHTESKNTNCILTKCYPHKDIVLIADFFHLEEKLVTELLHKGLSLTLGRLSDDFSIIRNNHCIFFDIELIILQLMGIPIYEEPDEYSSFELQN